MKSSQQRRHFLKQAAGLSGAALLGSSWTAQANSLLNTGFNAEGKKALVCINMYGGNDPHNFIVPLSASEYANYKKVRPYVAIPQDQLNPITPQDENTNSYGFHPELKGLTKLFQEGSLACLNNVGPATHPLRAGGGAPAMLNSHSHQNALMLGVDPVNYNYDRSGWVGRIADYVSEVENISFGGSNLWQTGRHSKPKSVDALGNMSYWGITKTSSRASMFDELAELARGGDHMLEREHSRFVEASRDVPRQFKERFSSKSGLDALVRSFKIPDTDLGKQLKGALKCIITQEKPRETFLIRFGNFDHHGSLINRQRSLLKQLDEVLYPFQRALQQLGLDQQVTTFTTSDFGRTLGSNGSGSDHAWGSHHMIFGGAVNGGRFYGRFPEMNLYGPDMANSKGTLRPWVSAEQYFATLGDWFGIQDSLRPLIFPYIENFTADEFGTNIGFMNS